MQYDRIASTRDIVVQSWRDTSIRPKQRRIERDVEDNRTCAIGRGAVLLCRNEHCWKRSEFEFERRGGM